MQIETLVLYSVGGEQRALNFRLGELNIITGDSQTGKSSLTNIFRYCLGSSRPGVPLGPIADTVAWYGLVVRVGDSKLFLGRPSGGSSGEVSAAMLLIEPEDVPSIDDLEPNTTADNVREYLAARIGIEENLNVPTIGQTRTALAASFVHSLYYCFQSQGEVANPTVLFHRQNLEWQTQAIRDTLPYFLGAQGLEELRLRQRLTDQRRRLRAEEQRLSRAEAEDLESVDRARSLLVEAQDTALLRFDDEAPSELALLDARSTLQSVVDQPLDASVASDPGAAFERIRLDLAAQRQRARELGEQLRGLENFSEVAAGYATELGEQRARLVSIGLVREDVVEAECPVCGSTLDQESGSDELSTVGEELDSISRRLELAGRDQPRIERARSELLEERDAVLQRIAELNETVSALADTNELIARERERVNVQSYVRGKIAEYLGSVVDLESAELEALKQRVTQLRTLVSQLEESLDPALLRSRVDSAVAIVSRDVTAIAERLGLEHASDGVRLDPNRLTVVADTPGGPAYLDAGNIGSGMNWVGYHLSVYFALHRFFIRNERPVPRFVLLDQPSQAFFPSDRVVGGELDELSDTDRAHTRDLYELMFEEVSAHGGALQVIALDHAEFSTDWFQASIVERWRNGSALIPVDWVSGGGESGAVDDPSGLSGDLAQDPE